MQRGERRRKKKQSTANDSSRFIFVCAFFAASAAAVDGAVLLYSLISYSFEHTKEEEEKLDGRAVRHALARQYTQKKIDVHTNGVCVYFCSKNTDKISALQMRV